MIIRYLLMTLLVFWTVNHVFASDCKTAIELYNQGTQTSVFSEQIHFLTNALNHSCKDKNILAKIHNNLADAYEKNQDFDNAIAHYEQAIAINPDLPTPYVSLGDVYAKKDMLVKSNHYYEQYYNRFAFKSKAQIVSSLNLRTPRAVGSVPTETLYFGFNNAAITEQSNQQLSELKSALQSNELFDYRVEIIGHTCDIGSDEYNQTLSVQRAEAVKNWLITQGYPSAQLTVKGVGKKMPYADNRTEQGKALNRRVQIKTVGHVLKPKRDPSPTLAEGYELFKQGEVLANSGAYRDAACVYEKSLTIFKQATDNEAVKATLGNLYLVYLELNSIDKAAKVYNDLVGVR